MTQLNELHRNLDILFGMQLEDKIVVVKNDLIDGETKHQNLTIELNRQAKTELPR